MAILGENMKDAMAWRNVGQRGASLYATAIAPSVWPYHDVQNHLNYENLGFSQIFTRVTTMGDDQNRGEGEKRNIVFSNSRIFSRVPTRSQWRLSRTPKYCRAGWSAAINPPNWDVKIMSLTVSGNLVVLRGLDLRAHSPVYPTTDGWSWSCCI
jgi:hypothetical protein